MATIANMNANSIARINQWKAEELQVNVFVGKTPSEPLPESKPGQRWVSLDINSTPSIDPNRVHLQIDCNSKEQMETIKGLFKTVVIDKSTAKFFTNENALDHFISLVQQGGSLIFPFEPQFFSIDDTVELFETNHFKLSVGSQKTKKLSETREQIQKEYLQHLTEGLSKDILTTDNNDWVSNTREYKDWETAELLNDPHALDDMPTFYRVTCFLSAYLEKKVEPLSYEDEFAACRSFTKECLSQSFNHVEIHHEIYPFHPGKFPLFYYEATLRK